MFNGKKVKKSYLLAGRARKRICYMVRERIKIYKKNLLQICKQWMITKKMSLSPSTALKAQPMCQANECRFENVQI